MAPARSSLRSVVGGLVLLIGAAAGSESQHRTLSLDPSCNPHCTSALNAAIAACQGSQYCTVTLAPGSYTLDGPAFANRIAIDGATNLALVGAGPTAAGTVLVADDISSVFSISGGTNVSFSGFALDMARVPFTYGQVTAVGPSSTVTFDSTGLYPINTTRYPWLNRAQGVLSFDPVNRRVAVNATDIYALDTPLNVSYISASGTSAQMLVGASLKMGDWVIVRHQTYSYNAFSASNTQGISWANVSLWAVGGMGILTNACTDVDILGLRIERINNRPMSITADGMHFSNTKGGFVRIRGSWFEGQGDDGMNIPTIFQAIAWVSTDRMSFQVTGRPGSPIVTNPVVGGGSTVNFFNRTSMQLLATGAVTGVAADGTITLAAPGLPPGIGLYSLINNPSFYADYVELTDSVFLANRARGALLKSSNVYAARNLFKDVSGPALKTETDGCYWFEGHPVTNWTAVNNTFLHVNYGVAQMQGDVTIDNAVPVFAKGQPTAQCTPWEGSPPVQSSLTISGNTFIQGSGMSAVAVYSVAGLTLQGNTVTREAGVPVPAYDFLGFGVQGDAVSGNTCDGQACKTSGL